MNLPEVRITHRALKAWRRGHPWVFKGELMAAPKVPPGEVVRVLGEKGGEVGFAFCNPRSLITLRRIDLKAGEELEAWLRRSLDEALEFRRSLGLFRGPEEGFRLVHAEADGLPGLILDRYGDQVAVQTLSAGIEKMKPAVVSWVSSLPGVKAVIERNDSSTRPLEGLEQKKGILSGFPRGPAVVDLSGLKVTVDVLNGQKTGAYLDQRTNREDALELARGRVLELFSYQGWFSLSLAWARKKGAALGAITAVDQSAPALDMLRRDAEAASLDGLETVKAHAFDFLEEAAEKKELYDTILLDPPAFAKSRRDVDAAKRGYREILKRACRILAPRGRLLFCSCSFHLSPEFFRQVTADGLADSGRAFRVLREGGAGPDHPVRIGFPESRYLKAVWLESQS